MSRSALTLLILIIFSHLGLHSAHAGQMVRVGVYNCAPFVTQEEGKKPGGFFQDILNYVADKEGWQIQYVPGTWSESLERLRHGEIDLLAPVVNSAEWEKEFDLNRESLFVEWGVVYARHAAEVNTVYDLEGQVVSCVRGSIMTVGFNRLLGHFAVHCRLLERDSFSQVLRDVELGVATAGISSNLIGLYHEGSYAVERTPIVFSPLKMMYAARKGSDRVLIDALDRHIRQLKADPDSYYYDARGRMLESMQEKRLPEWVKWGLVSLGSVILLLLVLSFILKRQVEMKTDELAKALRETQASETRFRAVFEQAATGIALVALDGHWLEVNQRLCDIIGYDAAELRSLTFQEITHPDDLAQNLEFGRKMLSGESGTFNVEKRYIRKDGTTIWIFLTVALVRTPNGQPDYFISILNDVSDRKQVEQTLQTYRDQLATLAEELSLAEERERRRIATELHDNICQTLALSSFKLSSLTGEAVPGEKGELAEEIKAMLDLSLDALRSLTLQICPPILYELGLQAALEWLCRCFREDYGLDIDFSDTVRGKSLHVKSRFAIFQMVRELLLNVVKHADTGKAWMRLVQDGSTLVITVADEGAGFDPWQPGRHNGTLGGFGLFNIRERINQLGGVFLVETAPGEGTRVSIRVPLQDDGGADLH